MAQRQGSGNGRGFAGMDPARQREIASQGGRASHASGHAHEWTSAEAAEAGRRGGLAAHHHRNAAFHHDTAAHHHRQAAHHRVTGEHGEADRHADHARLHQQDAADEGESAERMGREPEEDRRAMRTRGREEVSEDEETPVDEDRGGRGGLVS